MTNTSLSLLRIKLNRRNTPMTYLNKVGNHITQWVLYDAKRYDFDSFLLDNDWEPLRTLKDAWSFGIWSNEEAQAVLVYDEGQTYLIECPTYKAYLSQRESLASRHEALSMFGTADPDPLGSDGLKTMS